jgi:hypothetical protein
MHYLILGIIAALVIGCFFVVSMMVPSKANGAISLIDKSLADHGFDLALIARVNTFTAKPIYNPDTNMVDIELKWTPTNKAEESLDRYVVSGKRKDTGGKDMPLTLGTAKCNYGKEIVDCGCSHIGSAETGCRVRSQEGGEYVFTLDLMDEEKKEEKVNTYNTDPLKFYTDQFLQNLNEFGGQDTNMGDPYGYWLSGKWNYKSNVNNCKFIWVWATANVGFNSDQSKGSCSTAQSLIRTAITNAGFTLDSEEKNFVKTGLPGCVIKLNKDYPSDTEKDYEPCHGADASQKEMMTASINAIYEQMAPITFLAEICHGMGISEARNDVPTNYAFCISEVKKEIDKKDWLQEPTNDFPDTKKYASDQIAEFERTYPPVTS